MINPAGRARIPASLAVLPELTEDDVTWLNQQMALVDNPPIRYAREVPLPPLPSGKRPPPTDTSWLRTTRIRG